MGRKRRSSDRGKWEESEGGEGEGRKRKKIEGEKEREEEKRELRVGFWNMVGLNSKDDDFWREIQGWDVVGLSETWVEEKDWERVRGRLPTGFRWKCQHARRNKERGRGIGGMVSGVKAETEKVEWEERTWRTITVYVNNDIEEKLEKLKEKKDRRGRMENVMIGGTIYGHLTVFILRTPSYRLVIKFHVYCVGISCTERLRTDTSTITFPPSIQGSFVMFLDGNFTCFTESCRDILS